MLLSMTATISIFMEIFCSGMSVKPAKITEVFRRCAIKLFADRGLLDHRCAELRFVWMILS